MNLRQGGADYSYLYDSNDNVEAILDASQAVVAAYRYDPFGKLLAKTGTLEQPFGFSTKRYDAQTGLIYYGFRFYAPAIGRWTSRDPLGEAGGMNLYAFVGNTPLNWVDPWGLYRSHWLLRALVPGQISWDNAVTAFQNENYGGAALHTAAMLGEQLLVAYMWGQASALVQAGTSVLPTAADAVGEVCPVAETTKELFPYAQSLGAAGNKLYNQLAKLGNQAAGAKGKQAASLLRRMARKAGLDIVSGSNHLKVVDAAGKLITTIPNSPHSKALIRDIAKKIMEAAGF